MTRIVQRAPLVAIAGLLVFTGTATAAAPGPIEDYRVAHSSLAHTDPPPPLRAVHAPFPVDEPVVTGKSAGLIGDGKTDNTAAFAKLFAKPGRSVRIEAGDYVTSMFVIRDDTTVTFDPGVTIRDLGKLGMQDQMIRIVGSHVRLLGKETVIRAARHSYTTGEQRHGILINGVSDVTLQGIVSFGQGGDGFYVGGRLGKPATNITLIHCRADQNRRQGLSITNARNVDVIDSQFNHTNGTRPEFGIDLEPNHAEDFLDGISLVNVQTSGNKGGGLLLYLDRLTAKSAPIDVTIDNYVSGAEQITLQTHGAAAIPGTVRVIARK